jgi:hypothetical protein
MKRFLVSQVVVVITLLGSVAIGDGVVASIAGASSPKGGTVKAFVTPGSNGRATIVLTGAIGDYGTTQSIDANGKVDSSGAYAKVDLKHGSFRIDQSAFNKAIATASPVAYNSTTCSGYIRASGPITLLDGTGSYLGISGTVTLTITDAFVSPRYVSGAHKGQCNTSNGVAPLAEFASISGAGSVGY